MPFLRSGWMTLVVAAALCASAGPARAAQAPARDLAVPVLPPRKSTPPRARTPVELPPGADRVTPMTLHLRITTRVAGRVGERHQTVTRTASGVHVVSVADGSPAHAAAGGVEWLFERNPVDPRRASATYVAHAAKTIVTYSDSDLQTMLGIPGWAHILTMGVDPAFLAGVTPSSAPRAIDSSDGTRLVIERVSATADLQLVQPAELRFPAYRVVTLADWLEEH